MDGKTHAALGCAAALVLVLPDSPIQAVEVGMLGALGGILPDIGIQTSKVSKIAQMLILPNLLGFVVGMCFAFLVDIMYADNTYAFIAYVALHVFLVLGVYDTHRGFTHSVAAACYLAVAVSAFSVSASQAVVVGYVSHLAADFLNMRGEQLFWPFHKRVCLHVCSADGVASRAVWVASVLAGIMCIVRVVVHV